MSKEPHIVQSHDVRLDADYAEWLKELKNRYRKAQVKAAIKVNSEKLLWNWQLGRDLVMRKAEAQWGDGIVEQLSLDLQAEFPGEQGFSASNLWYMKRWYSFYTSSDKVVKLEQAIQEIQPYDSKLITKLDQVGQVIHEDGATGIPFPPIFAYIPWRHHVEIIKKCKTIEEAIFYIVRTIDGDWSRNYLLERLKANDYHNRNILPNNFDLHLPEPQSTLAKEVIKENLDFNFISLPPKYNESQLEEALCQQMTRFLLELGSGFAFIGRQKEIVVAGKTRKIDLLFYHYRLRSFIVVELKARPFEPEYAGKLNFYVAALNNLLKTPEDNPTIGLLICSDMNKTEVQWSFDSMQNPMGVAAYKNVNEIAAQLPSIEQLQERIKLLEEEIREQSLKETKD